MRKALCVGINYVGTEYELRGCINDADQWAAFLGANKFNVAILAEQQATRTAILVNLGRLINTLKAGDIGFFTYSGHGTWVPDVSGDEADGRDEAICPIDMGDDGHNLIIDDEFGAMYDRLAPGATMIVAFDSCHSGTAYRAIPAFGGLPLKRRFLPPARFHLDKPTLERVFDTHPAPKAKDGNAGLIYFAGCRDVEYANDTVFNSKPCGAFTHFAVPAFQAALTAGGTYQSAFKAVRKALPNRDLQQTPQLSATVRMAATKIFA